MSLAFGGPGRYSTPPSEPVPIPAWAAYLIAQSARTELTLARLLEMQGIDMTAHEQLSADIAQLIEANSQIVAYETQQVIQVAELQGQVAALQAQVSNGSTVTTEDLAALDAITAKIVATAADAHATASSTATAPAPTPSPEPQAPITSVPVDQVPPTDEATVEQQTPVVSGPVDMTDTAAAADTVSTAETVVDDGSGISGW